MNDIRQIAQSAHTSLNAYELTVPIGGQVDAGVANESFYYVLSGYGLLNIEKYGYSLEPETALYIPAGTEHFITNSGAFELRILRYTV